MRSWVKSSPLTAGLLLVAAGVIAIFLAWNGAAGLDHVQGQVPYLISGGLLGLGLIGAGLTVVNVQARRQDTAEVLARLQELAEALHHQGPATTGPTLAAVPTGEVVVAGTSTYHLASCRVVADKDVEVLALADAAAYGLTACRICQPPAVATA